MFKALIKCWRWVADIDPGMRQLFGMGLIVIGIYPALVALVKHYPYTIRPSIPQSLSDKFAELVFKSVPPLQLKWHTPPEIVASAFSFTPFAALAIGAVLFVQPLCSRFINWRTR
jgi:hypothetical protein